MIVAGDDQRRRRPLLAAACYGRAWCCAREGRASSASSSQPDLVDELCLSLAPLLAGGESPRLAHGPAPDAPARMRLDRLLEEDDLLFCRYVRVTAMATHAH